MARQEIFIAGTDMNKYHLHLPDLDASEVVPGCTAPGYVDRINAIIKKHGITFVHAQPDIEVEILGKHRKEINARTMLPSNGTIEKCRNKMNTNRILSANSVPVPKSYLIENASDIPRLFNELYGITKKVWVRAVRGAGSRAALPVYNPDQLMNWIFYWISNKEMETRDFMISEYLPGKEFAWQSLWRDGKLITSQARERIEYLFGNLSVSGQSSSPSVARTVHRTDVNQVATAAIKAIDEHATGIFCVDLKENIHGTPCVTEINAGRFFTTSNFFSALGLNMPYMYVLMAHDQEIPTVPQYNPLEEGLYWVRLPDAMPKLLTESDVK
jgi:carbamoyl-phosphate synthase large subunit